MKTKNRIHSALTSLGLTAALLLSASASAQSLASSSFGGTEVSASANFTMMGTFNPTAGRPCTTGESAGYSANLYPGQFAGQFLPDFSEPPVMHLVPTAPGILTLVAVPDLPGWLWARSEDLQSWSLFPDPTANPVLIETSKQREFFRLELP